MAGGKARLALDRRSIGPSRLGWTRVRSSAQQTERTPAPEVAGVLSVLPPIRHYHPNTVSYHHRTRFRPSSSVLSRPIVRAMAVRKLPGLYPLMLVSSMGLARAACPSPDRRPSARRADVVEGSLRKAARQRHGRLGPLKAQIARMLICASISLMLKWLHWRQMDSND